MAPAIDAAADALRAARTARDAFARAGSALLTAGHDLQPGATADAIAADVATAATATRRLESAPVGTVPDATRTLLTNARSQADRWRSLVGWQQPSQWADLLHSWDTPTSALESASILLDPAAAITAGAGDANRGAAILHARAAADHLERGLTVAADGRPESLMAAQADVMSARTLVQQLDGPDATRWQEQARALWAKRSMPPKADAEPATHAAHAAAVTDLTASARATAAELRAAAAGATSPLRLAGGTASFATAGLVRDAGELRALGSAATERAAAAHTLDDAGQLATARQLGASGSDLARTSERVYTARDARQLPIGAASPSDFEDAAHAHFAGLLDLPVVRERLPEQLGIDIETLEHASRNHALAQAMHVESGSYHQPWNLRLDAVDAALTDAHPAAPTLQTHPLTMTAQRMRAAADDLGASGAALDLTGWRSDRAGTLTALRNELAGWSNVLADASTTHPATKSLLATDGHGPTRDITRDARLALSAYSDRMRELHASDLGRTLPQSISHDLHEAPTTTGIVPTHAQATLARIRTALGDMTTIAEPTAATHPTLFATRGLQVALDQGPRGTASAIAGELATASRQGREVLIAPTWDPSRSHGVSLIRGVLDSRQAALADAMGAREGDLSIDVLDAWAKVDSSVERYRPMPEPGRLDTVASAAGDLDVALRPGATPTADAATTTRLKAASQQLRDLTARAHDASRSPEERLNDVVDLAGSVRELTGASDPGAAWRTARVRHVVKDLAGLLGELRSDSSLPFDGATRRTLRGAQNELEYVRDARFADDQRILLDDAREAVEPVLSLRAPGGILAPGTSLRMLPPGDLNFIRTRVADSLAKFAEAQPIEAEYEKVHHALPMWSDALAGAEDALVASSDTVLPEAITSRMLARVDELARQVEAASLQYERSGSVGESRQPKRGLLGFVRKDVELLRDLSDPAMADALAPDAI